MAKKRKPVRSRKRSYKSNPSKKRKIKSSAKSIAKRGFMGLSFKKAHGNVPATQIGMFAAKWAARRLVMGDSVNYATETDPGSWNYLSYLKAAFGGVGAGVLTNMLKPGAGQKVLEGALNYVVFKAIQNEIIYKSDWATAQFGAEDEAYTPDEYLLTGADENWFLGPDGNTYPTDERYRLPSADYAGLGKTLQPVGPLGDLVRVDQLGAFGSVAEDYRRAYFHQA